MRTRNDPGMDLLIHRDACQPANLQNVCAIWEAFGQIIHLVKTALLKVHGDAIGTGFGDDAIEGHDDNARIAGLLDGTI